MTEALVPDFNLTAQIKAERKARLEENLQASKDGPTPADKALAQLSFTPGWGHLEDYIRGQIEALHAMVEGAIGEGASFAEIGERATLAQLAGEELESIIDFVNSKAQNVEQT